MEFTFFTDNTSYVKTTPYTFVCFPKNVRTDIFKYLKTNQSVSVTDLMTL